MRKYTLTINDKEYNAEVKSISTESATIIVDDKEYQIDLKDIGRQTETSQTIPDRPVASEKTVPAQVVTGKPVPVEKKVAKQASHVHGSGNGVPAPLPGLVVDILVNENASVKSGQTIAIMEAMKMENQIQAPHDGTIKKIFVSKGDSVAEGDILIEIERSVMSSL